MLKDDMKLMDQKQKALLLRTQEADWASCSYRLPLILKSHGNGGWAEVGSRGYCPHNMFAPQLRKPKIRKHLICKVDCKHFALMEALSLLYCLLPWRKVLLHLPRMFSVQTCLDSPKTCWDKKLTTGNKISSPHYNPSFSRQMTYGLDF